MGISTISPIATRVLLSHTPGWKRHIPGPSIIFDPNPRFVVILSPMDGQEGVQC